MNNQTSLIDFGRVEQSFCRSIDTYNQHAVVQAAMCNELMQVLLPFLPSHSNCALEIGAGTGLFTQQYLQHTAIDCLYLNDLVAKMEIPLREVCKSKRNNDFFFLPGNAQTISLPQNIDLAVSAATLQWFSQLDLFIQRLHRSQTTGGVFAFSSFGPQNMIEVNTVSGQGLQYLTQEQLRAVLEPFYLIHIIKEDLCTMWFDTPTDVLRHLKLTGVNGLGKRPWTRQSHQQFDAAYRQQFETNKRVSLTYHPLYVVCTAK